MKAALLIAIAGCKLACSPPAAADPAPGPDYPVELVREAARLKADWPLLQVEIRVTDCGDRNAFFVPTSKAILICTEILDNVDEAQWALAHEWGHAVLDANELQQSESDADEFANLWLAGNNKTDLMRRMAKVLVLRPDGDDDGTHPSWRERGDKMACVADGAEEVPKVAACRRYLIAARLKWSWFARVGR